MKKPSLPLRITVTLALYALVCVGFSQMTNLKAASFFNVWLASVIVLWPLLIAMLAVMFLFYAAAANGPMPESSQNRSDDDSSMFLTSGINSRGETTFNGFDASGDPSP